MAPHLCRNRSVGKCLKGLILSELNRAIDFAQSPDQAVAEKIHFARTQCKRVRGLLKLARQGDSAEQARQLNTELRDAAGMLSELRDAYVLHQSISDAVEWNDRTTKSNKRGDPRSVIRQRTAVALPKDAAAIKKLAAYRTRLKKAKRTLENWHLVITSAELLDGIKKTYRAGYRIARLAPDDISTEDEHELRKRVKALMYQLEFIEAIWRPVVGEMAAQTKKLAKRLGESRDFQLAADYCKGNEWDENFESIATQLVRCCNQRIEQLQPTIRRLARRFYAERPKDFVERLRTYWKIWESRS